jgi:hypothetical protein
MEDDQNHRNNLQEIKLSALSILARINSADTVDVQNAMGEYAALVDRFYRDNEHLMAPQQYRVAKTDFEYFMRLLDLAIAYYTDGVEGGKGAGRGMKDNFLKSVKRQPR